VSDAANLFDAVWARICANEREFFKTDGGRWFTYRIEAEELRPSQSDIRISRSEFERVFPLLPVPPAKMNKYVKGPAYVWAILHDPRISEGRW
jgi:hypothetical protein